MLDNPYRQDIELTGLYNAVLLLSSVLFHTKDHIEVGR